MYVEVQRYNFNGDTLNLESLIKSPSHWLGNLNFSNFTGPAIYRLKEPQFNKSIGVERPVFKNLKTVKAWDDINQTKDDLNIPNPHKDSWSNEELLHIRYSTIGIIMVVVGIIIHFLLL